MNIQFLDNLEIALEFVLAIGSILGWFIVVLSVIGIIFSSKKLRVRLIWLIAMGGVLIILCGPETGFQYFFFH